MFDTDKAIIPMPLSITGSKKDIILGNVAKAKIALCVSAGGDCMKSAEELLLSVLQGFGVNACADAPYCISVTVDSNDPHFCAVSGGEAYVIYSLPDGAKLVGSGEAGAFYAAISFSKLLHSAGSKLAVSECTVFDSPVFKTRGHFFECRWGSDFMTFDEWKRVIDELADMKINNIIMGMYGCWSRQYDGRFSEYQYFPLKSHPELNTPRSIKYYSAKDKKWHYKKDVLPTIYTDDYFGELIAYAKRKNIEVVPLFNSLGHNTLIPRLHPEISAVQEDGSFGNFGMCTNNAKTYELMYEIYDEIIERYLVPNDIHSFAIGMDEVCGFRGVDESDLSKITSPFCKCEKCKSSEYDELMIRYVISIAKHMKQKGIKNLYIYHDMFFEKGRLNEELAERFKKEGVWDIIVIDWWNYNGNEEFFDGKTDEISTCMRSTGKPISGYYYWCIPTHSADNVVRMARLAEEKEFEGMIAYSTYDDTYDFNFKMYAQYCWNPHIGNWKEVLKQYAILEFPDCADEAFDVLEIAVDFMHDYFNGNNLSESFYNFYFASYLRDARDYPQDYPAKRYREMSQDEPKYIGYLEKILTSSNRVYEFFERNTTGRTSEIWKLIALNYSVLCDIYYTMYTSAADYNAAKIDAEALLKRIERLICKTDKYMSLCEDVRIRANQYITLRNMSIERQILCDFGEYIKAQLAADKKPQIDLNNCGSVLSDLSWFLR